MSTVMEIDAIIEELHSDKVAEGIVNTWNSWQSARSKNLDELKELREYIFATSTRDTSNSKLPWKNSTVTPKLTQIRDNLHANYMATLFPTEEYFKWGGDDQESNIKEKRIAIESYMQTKARQSKLKKVISELVYDYIDFGEAIGDTEYVHEEFKNDQTGEIIQGYIGPRAVRISPEDIVFNPVATSFDRTPKIVRYIKTIGQLKAEMQDSPDKYFYKKILEHTTRLRGTITGFDRRDFNKNAAFYVDGFESAYAYFNSDIVEILEFEGDIHSANGRLQRNRRVVVVDRSKVISNKSIPSWSGRSTKCHTVWRKRPDNLRGMGPLVNLMGMQYRIDHLENLKADLFDLIAYPPIKIKGNVEEFEWGPFSEIMLGDDGEVEVLRIDAIGLQADMQIQLLEQKMEEMAGAPKEAMGIRTPGEKTAYEIQRLENASSRIFENKTQQFEEDIIEPLLNNMLEVARRNLEGADVVKVLDDDLGVTAFNKVTKDDITAAGKLYAIGARHYASRARLVQELTQLANSRLFDLITPHIKSMNVAKLMEDALGWERWDLFEENAQIAEQQNRQRMLNVAEEDLILEE